MPNPSANPRIALLNARKRPAVAFAIGVLACALLFLISAQAWNAWSARQLRLSQAAADTSNMARALAAQGESTIRIVDTVLASVVESVQNDGIANITSGRLEEYLRERVQDTSYENMALALGRSLQSVYARRSILGLPVVRKSHRVEQPWKIQ